MTKLTYIRTKNREEWLTKRREMSAKGMVGGSDAGTIMGLNNYKSRVKLFYQAIGYEPQTDIDNEIMFHGRNLEDYVADLWQYYDGSAESMLKNHLERKKTKSARRVNAMVINSNYPWMFANIDRSISKHPLHKGKGVLEIKTMSSYHSEVWESGVPPTYIIQIQHYMIVTGNKYAELAMLMDGRKFETIPFEAHPQVQEKIINSTFDFNQRVLQGLELMTQGMPDDELIHALSEIQPDPEDNEAFNDYMSERHKKRINEKKIHATPVVLEAAKEYKRILSQSKEIETAKLEATGIIKNYMESNSASVVDMGDNGQITWRKQLNVNYKEVNDGKNNLGF